MTAKKYFLIGAAVAAIAGLTAVGELFAASACTPATCNYTTQVQCGTRNGCPVCVDIFPTKTVAPDGQCTFDWRTFNTGNAAQAAIAYQCTLGIAATTPTAQGCGVGTNFAFSGNWATDSVLLTANTTCSDAPNCSRMQYTIPSCSEGINSVAFKFGSTTNYCTGDPNVPNSSGAIVGYGITNLNQTLVSCQEQVLGDSDCRIKTCFTYGAGNLITGHEITVVGGSCEITLNQGPLPVGVTDIPDGTIIKFGTTSCYQVTFLRKTTWVATSPDTTATCPPTS